MATAGSQSTKTTPAARLGGLLSFLAKQGRAIIGQLERAAETPSAQMGELASLLLSRQGEASGEALARTLIETYQSASAEERGAFFQSLLEDFGPDMARLDAALEAIGQERTPASLAELQQAAEPRRQEVLRRLNTAPGGTMALIRMREDLLQQVGDQPELRTLDRDFVHLFASWFNRGFLEARPIDWHSPAYLLEKIVRYEAVHVIKDWTDLRNRLLPEDRRCFGFFHPQLKDEPLIFVEVALTQRIPEAIAPLLDADRQAVPAQEADTAVFYSISTTQKGLKGISFGELLIKAVVEQLRRERPQLSTWVTLSPLPGFADWLDAQQGPDDPLDETSRSLLQQDDWYQDADLAERIRPALLRAAARYLTAAKNARGLPLDPVARFHLGNGARLERINFCADLSAKALAQSYGIMVNYRYLLEDIERNHEAFAEEGRIATASEVDKLLSHS